MKYYIALGIGPEGDFMLVGSMIYYLVLTVPISIIVKNLKVAKKWAKGNDAKLDIIAIVISTIFIFVLPLILMTAGYFYKNFK